MQNYAITFILHMTFLAVLYPHVILQVLEGWRERSTLLNFEDSITLDVLQVICFSIYMGHYRWKILVKLVEKCILSKGSKEGIFWANVSMEDCRRSGMLV